MADIPKDPAAEVGRVVLFIGVEAKGYTVENFKEAAQFAAAHKVDTLCPKRADGSIRWYPGLQHLKDERAAVLSEVVGYLPFGYCYGPAFCRFDGEGRVVDDRQIRDECAVLEEMMGVDHDSVCADCETEWNGQNECASIFNSIMRPIPGLLFLTTFADPVTLDFPSRQFAPCVNAWVPQDYDNFLANCEAQQILMGMSIRYPALDLSQEFGPNNVVELASRFRAKGAQSLWLWDLSYALQNPELLDKVVAAFKE